MVRQERIAWLNLSTVGLALFTFGVLSFVIGTHRALGAFGLLGLLGLIPMVYGPFKGGRVTFDERDRQILSNSLQIAYATFWLVFVASSMTLFYRYQGAGTLPATILPLFPLVGWIVVTSVQSLATVVQYRKGRE